MKFVLMAAALLALFTSLIYFQLRFYREGDMRGKVAIARPPDTDIPTTPLPLKSPYHKAIWENMEHTRKLMRYKEKLFYEDQKRKEKLVLGLPPEEEILFMADRSQLFLLPIAFCSLSLLFIAGNASQEFSEMLPFACHVIGFSGLLLLIAAKNNTRYYLTNYRVLIRKKLPLAKAHWSALNYPGISHLSRKKKLVGEALSLKSRTACLNIKGLRQQQMDTFIEILVKKLPVERFQA